MIQKNRLWLGCVAILVVAATGSISQASIIAASAADDGDGVVTCATCWNSTDYSTTIGGVQHSLVAGHVLGNYTTDTELDPTVKISNSIDNDTGYSWIGYIVNITMSKAFSISAVTAPSGWTTSVVNQPTQSGNDYIGQIVYTTASPLADGGTIDFGYKLSFLGSVAYTQEMIPVAAPEPATMSLLAMGGLAMLRRGRKA